MLNIEVHYEQNVWVPRNRVLRWLLWIYRACLIPAVVVAFAVYVGLMYLAVGRGAPGRIRSLAELIRDWAEQ
jgi:hypothetical protein